MLAAAVTGHNRYHAGSVPKSALADVADPLNRATSVASAAAAAQGPQHSLQLLQPLLGYEHYEVTIKGTTPLPPMEYRLT